jgi:hypothetical protein
MLISSEQLYKGAHLLTRRYLLSLFLENEYVKRSQISEKTGLDYISVTNMFGEIATLKKGTGWTLKTKEDAEFIKK